MAGWRRAIGAVARKRDPFGRLFLLTAPLILGLLILASALAPDSSTPQGPALATDGQIATLMLLIDAIAATMLVGTGCSAIMRWRLSSEQASLSVGIATLALAFLWLLPTRLLAPGFDLTGPGITAVAAIGLLVVMLALVTGLRGVPVLPPTRLGVTRHWWWVVAVPVALVTIAGSGLARLTPSVATSFAPEARLALFAFASMASLYLLVGHRQRRWLHGWIGLGLMALCYAELQVAYSGGRLSFHLVAAMLRLVAAGIMLNGVARELIDAYVAQQQRLFGAVLNVQAVELGKAAARSREAEIRHDLRSGLMSIQAALGALARTRADTEFLSGATLSEAVSAEIRRLWVLTDQERETDPVVFDLAEALQPTVTCHRSLLRLEASVPEGLMLRGQPDAVIGTIVNLLANARAHATGATVHLTAAREGPFVEIEVSDDGPGVADEVRPRLFDRGFTTRRDGTGLGLDIALQLTRSQGGDLFCDRPEVGARFRLVLPAARDASEEPLIDLTEPSVPSS